MLPLSVCLGEYMHAQSLYISMPMFIAFVFSSFPSIEMHVFLFSCVGVIVLF